MKINEPVGVIGIACPDEYPLLGFVSLFAPAVIRGNTMVIIPSERYPLSATDLYQASYRLECLCFIIYNVCISSIIVFMFLNICQK